MLLIFNRDVNGITVNTLGRPQQRVGITSLRNNMPRIHNLDKIVLEPKYSCTRDHRHNRHSILATEQCSVRLG